MAPRSLIAACAAAGLALAAAPAAVAEPGETFRDCEACPEMVVIPAGSFTMGSPDTEEGHLGREAPQHEVSFAAPFAIGKYEVTFAEWDACIDAGACGRTPDDEGWGRDTRPVINVTWQDAQDYVAWLSRATGHTYRLPSEAEWEYAARAGTTGARPWGSSLTSVCHHANTADEEAEDLFPDFRTAACSDAHTNTAPVGSYAANGFGLHDMLGNVWEWVEDCPHDNYEGAPTDGSVWAGGNCEFRVLRGGSWADVPNSVRLADRISLIHQFNNSGAGFRVVRALAE